MPPVVIAAGIGAAAGIGGGILSASAQKKAANKASDTALQTATQNNALQQQIYNSNVGYLSPYANRGNEAGDAYNALLGISGDPAAYQKAYQDYLNSTGYQFQIDQGEQAINQGYAAKGSLQSGAALKALQTYGQNTATGFFKDYLGLLAGQEGMGLSGASAIAGVGQGYANAANQNNNNAGNAAANAALLAGNANANMYGNIAGTIGGVANVFGSSYKPKGY